MKIKGFNMAKKMLYSDTPVPDIFITKYISQMDSEYFKVYIYCLFLHSHNKSINENIIARALNTDKKTVDNAITYFIEKGLAKVENNVLILNDIKDIETKKYYIEDKNENKPKKRKITKEQETVIKAINNQFFQGVMGLSWYADIGKWFEKYRFETDVMYQLFNMCYEKNALSNNSYIKKVAQDWHSKNIKTDFDLQKYLKSRNKVSAMSDRISKKLRLHRKLTEYEENTISKWVMDFGYDFKIIEKALKFASNITNPNINYFDKIITNWYNNGLKDASDIDKFNFKKRNNKNQKRSKKKNKPTQMNNFTQRKYDKDFLESLYEEL